MVAGAQPLLAAGQTSTACCPVAGNLCEMQKSVTQIAGLNCYPNCRLLIPLGAITMRTACNWPVRVHDGSTSMGVSITPTCLTPCRRHTHIFAGVTYLNLLRPDTLLRRILNTTNLRKRSYFSRAGEVPALSLLQSPDLASKAFSVLVRRRHAPDYPIHSGISRRSRGILKTAVELRQVAHNLMKFHALIFLLRC